MKFINATLYGDTLIQLPNAQLTEGTLSTIKYRNIRIILDDDFFLVERTTIIEVYLL